MAEVKIGQMTKERLKQYRTIRIEILELEYKLRNLGEDDSMIGNDTVFDYRSGYPQPQSVVGVDWDKVDRTVERYEKRLNCLKKECREIEEFIDGISDSRTRQIFEMSFLEGKKQREIGRKIHLERSMVSKIIEEYMKVSHNSQNSHV